MKPYVTIEFPGSGRVYQVPSSLIADDRIKSRLSLQIPGDSPDSVRAEIEEEFGDDFTMVDWAKNNMRWSEIEPKAILTNVYPRTLANEWDNATLSPTTEQAAPMEMDGDTFLSLPMLAVFQGMAQRGEELSIVPINSDQPVGAAVFVVMAQQEIVQGYMATVAQFNQFLAGQREAGAITPAVAH